MVRFERSRSWWKTRRNKSRLRTTSGTERRDQFVEQPGGTYATHVISPPLALSHFPCMPMSHKQTDRRRRLRHQSIFVVVILAQRCEAFPSPPYETSHVSYTRCAVIPSFVLHPPRLRSVPDWEGNFTLTTRFVLLRAAVSYINRRGHKYKN